MQFGRLDNIFLVASGLIGDISVVVFERVRQGAEFVQVASNKDIPNLASLVWVWTYTNCPLASTHVVFPVG